MAAEDIKQEMTIQQALNHALEFQKNMDYDTAGQVLTQLYAQVPESVDTLHYLGLNYCHQGEIEKGLEMMEASIKQRPDNSFYHSNIAAMYRSQLQLDKAEEHFQQALSLDPKNVKALFPLAADELQQGNYHTCAKYLSQLLAVEPENEEALYYLALSLQYNKEFDKAIQVYNKLLEINPDHEHAMRNIAGSYQEKREFVAAVQCYQKALEKQPDNLTLRRDLYFTAADMCLWDVCDELKPRLLKELDEIHEEEGRFQFEKFVFPCTPAQLKMHAECYANHLAGQMAVGIEAVKNVQSKPSSNRIRVGYLSGDFNNHPVGHLIRKLFTCHDKSKFEIFCFTYSNEDNSFYQQSIYNDAEHVINVKDLSFIDTAKRVKEEGIDILIDLQGYTRNSRSHVMFMRPAPIQVNYLGYPGTLGTDCYDYIIVDDDIVPKEHYQYYSETPIALPNTYMITDNEQPVAKVTPSRAECGLPEDAIVYCCFNNGYKHTREMFNSWLRILENVPNSVLWLGIRSLIVEENMRKEVAKSKVSQDRVIIAKPIEDKTEHLARIRNADLFLDCHYYNAHTTAVDALWCGVPVLAYPGETFQSRVSMSLLNNVGLSKLVTHSFAEYEKLAIKFGRHPKRLKRVRKTLQKNLSKTPLFDTVSMTKDLERAYEKMYRNLQK